MITLVRKNITLEEIENKVSQKHILEFYIGNISKPICSPFRKDKNPSLTFKNKGNKVIWKDWGTGEGGDAITFLMLYFNLSFKEVLNKIWNEMVSNHTVCYMNYSNKENYVTTTTNFIKHESNNDINVIKQSFGFFDRKFWKNYGISIKTLIKYDVFSLKSINFRRYNYFYSINNPLYGYCFSNNIWKIYMPNNNKKRFLFNGTKDVIEGYKQLDAVGKILFITKSLKDVMLFRELGYNAISLIGETVLLEQYVYDNLKERFDKIFVFYDNDPAGIKGADKICSTYNIQKMLIPDKFETKDLTDTYRKYGLEITTELIKDLLDEKGINLYTRECP